MYTHSDVQSPEFSAMLWRTNKQYCHNTQFKMLFENRFVKIPKRKILFWESESASQFIFSPIEVELQIIS